MKFSEVETLRGAGRPAECFGCRDVQESRGKIWLWPVGCGFSSWNLDRREVGGNRDSSLNASGNTLPVTFEAMCAVRSDMDE